MVNLDQAIQNYEKALLTDPRQPAIWQSLGEAKLELKKNSEPQTAYENALRLDGAVEASQGATTPDSSAWQQFAKKKENGSGLARTTGKD